MKNIVMVILMLCSTSAHAESWKIATLEWPPFVCSACYKNGAAADALREALKVKGIDVEFVFYPWVQARKVGARRDFVGYFPAWKESVLPGFMASDPLFSSPVVFLERRDAALEWKKLADLKGKTFGLTKDYGNTVEFNKLVKDGTFKTITLLNEESTVRKLIERQVDAVLIDEAVGAYYLSHVFPTQKNQLKLGRQVLENKDLYMVFNEGSLQKTAILNAALKQINYQKIVDDYVKKNFKQN
jgi:polar amino acid transport system substrate-binding protein